MPTNIPVFTNVALNRPAAQSSVGWGGQASRAVDGNINKMWGGWVEGNDILGIVTHE